ncbi:hypothetical protein F8568_045305 [Actinomadura sp. LD22]|uniref:Uncharacterized protein n=1 Tax=Actinomadura physcomitrii TaxID=2650748 RepID=A0A6I4MRL8_9ACTN|nr:hypothetical protein [Actinomadura physcomitrii]MWA07425.1 hypothetical protein [Actinomadura physcomitrii]
MARSATGYTARILVSELTNGFPTAQWQLGRERDQILFTGIDIANSSAYTVAIRTYTRTVGSATYLYVADTNAQNDSTAFRKLLVKPRRLFAE